MSTVLNIYKRVWHKYSTCLHTNQIKIIIFTSHKMLACEEVVVWEIFSSILFMLYYFLLNRNFICTFLWCPEIRSFLYSKIIFEIHSRISNNNIDNSRWCVVAFLHRLCLCVWKVKSIIFRFEKYFGGKSEKGRNVFAVHLFKCTFV